MTKPKSPRKPNSKAWPARVWMSRFNFIPNIQYERRIRYAKRMIDWLTRYIAWATWKRKHE